MLKTFKSKIYFFVASYFRFFARIQLNKWQPKVVVVTGSSGKTTLLHLLKSQLGDRVRYSDHANSSFGIPFDILGLKRKSLKKTEWLYLFLAAPFKALKPIYPEKIYIVEADCDRPGEGIFLASWLKPSITILTGISRTHSMNFDKAVSRGGFATVEQAIAYEFGYFLEYAKEAVIINGDDSLSLSQLVRSKAGIIPIKQSTALQSYKIFENSTQFIINNQSLTINSLLPKEAFYSVAAVLEIVKRLDQAFNLSFNNFHLPPGRSSVFGGIKNTTLLDSSYNANLDSMKAVLGMFELYPAKIKWVVLGDMLEQGQQEQHEHEQLAEVVRSMKLQKIILMGPRVSRYTYPKLKALLPNSEIIKFEDPKPTLDYLLENLQGGETVLFKGARFLEGVIEHLLADKNDVSKLCRREKVWQERRKEWGL